MKVSSSNKLLKISGKPPSFYGTVRLPPSKSYLHRALFVSALANSKSVLTKCGPNTNEDIQATVRVLGALGAKIRMSRKQEGSVEIIPGSNKSSNVELDAGGSGTTARFLIPFSALSPNGTRVTIVGNESLSNRPMQTIFEPLSKLGVKVKSINENGKLPVTIEGGGIDGGSCEIDGSTSSQFVSSLLISCTKAAGDTVISIKNPEDQVSEPYIEATIQVIRGFGFRIRGEKSSSGRYTSFGIPGKQSVNGCEFAVPGDMSSGAALIGACIAVRGRVKLTNTGAGKFHQPDSAVIPLARHFGARVLIDGDSMKVSVQDKRVRRRITLNLRDSPDLVPTIAGVAAATETRISISKIGHLRIKESDRIGVLSRELCKMGVKTEQTESSLSVLGACAKERPETTFLSPEGDHRMLMAFAIAGLSGKFGTIFIRDPGCVKKSYPSFITDLQKLCHEKSSLKIVNTQRSTSIAS